MAGGGADMIERDGLGRRWLLSASLALPAALLLGRAGRGAAQTGGSPAPPACGAPTPAAVEGPYWKSRSPQRATLLEPGVTGPRLVVSGVVRGKDCAPVAGAMLDFWQADAAGAYDNAGFRLRGHQLTDAQGRFELVTVLPGVYPGRTRHLHVKVQVPGQPALTTQLYFPGERQNAGDGLFDRQLLMRMEDGAGGKVAAFDFVLDGRGQRRA
jgi:protocatechuate 3,4-dioxygenase beta subunit